MSLCEKKTPPYSSLSRESNRAAMLNMIYGVMLWSTINIIIAMIDDSSKNELSSTSGLIVFPVLFVMLTLIGVIISIVPTIIGAKILSNWLRNRKTTRISAMIAGAIIGALAITLLAFPFSLIIALGQHVRTLFFSRLIFLLTAFNLPIAICAALAGGRTGLQLARFIETTDYHTMPSQ